MMTKIRLETVSPYRSDPERQSSLDFDTKYEPGQSIHVVSLRVPAHTTRVDRGLLHRVEYQSIRTQEWNVGELGYVLRITFDCRCVTLEETMPR
jgi:hypothetical protein